MLIPKLRLVVIVLLLQFCKVSVGDFNEFVRKKVQDFPAYARSNCPDPSFPIEQKIAVIANNTLFNFETEFSNLTYSGFSYLTSLDVRPDGNPMDVYFTVAIEIPPGFQQQGWHVTNWSIALGCQPLQSSGNWNTLSTTQTTEFQIRVNFELLCSGYLRVAEVIGGFRIFQNYVYMDNISNHEAVTDLYGFEKYPVLMLVREYGEITKNPISQCVTDFWNQVFEQTPFLEMLIYMGT